MDCEKCRSSKPVDKEQLIQDLIDYLDYKVSIYYGKSWAEIATEKSESYASDNSN